MYRRIVAVILAAVLVMGMSACSKKTAEDENGNDYDAQSAEIYEANMGEFAGLYDEAIAIKDDNSARYANMAIAEAKFLESAVFLPIYAGGGRYCMGTVAPNTTPQVLWGMDSYDYASSITTEEIISSDDVEIMNEKYAELKGTGKYSDWAKKYLKSKGYTLSDYYGKVYSDNPTTWDIHSTYLAITGWAVLNTMDFLMEYDCEGTLQPALAKSYNVSDDGLTYTFNLRKGVKWVDCNGRKVAEVTADDFVCGLQHLCDCKGGSEYMAGAAGANIKNVDEYIAGSITDFSEVGIKAVDDYTLEYTLTDDTSFFMTMLSTSAFAPLNREYYESQGGKFGKDFDSSAADYSYGKDYEHIIGYGPYFVTSNVENNSITFEANPDYYNADKVNIKNIKWVFSDGTDALYNYECVKNGDTSVVEMNESSVEKAKEEGNFDKYTYIEKTDAQCFGMFTNLNRQAFANSNDGSKAVSEQTYEDKDKAQQCMGNAHFRKALFMSIDRIAYNAESNGEELKGSSVTNGFTPGNYVSLDKKTTVSINGKDATFKAGTYYGEIVQAQLNADEAGITVWDENGNSGLGSSSGFDGWHNEKRAAKELDAAIEELGIDITEENPVHLDLPMDSSSTRFTNSANVIKQSIEKALGGKVIIDTVECADTEEWYYAGYYCDKGSDCNYNIYDCSGWGPDYGDPQTYLGAFAENGDLTSHLGIY